MCKKEKLDKKTLEFKNSLFFAFQNCAKGRLSGKEYNGYWYDILNYFCDNWKETLNNNLNAEEYLDYVLVKLKIKSDKATKKKKRTIVVKPKEEIKKTDKLKTKTQQKQKPIKKETKVKTKVKEIAVKSKTKSVKAKEKKTPIRKVLF